MAKAAIQAQKGNKIAASSTYEAGSAYSASMGAPDRSKYRRTPPEQARVPEIVSPGMEIRTSYDTGGIVAEVAGPFPFTAGDGAVFLHYTLIYVPPEKWGRHKPKDHSWINECVAVDGRILKLFEANTDEVFITIPKPKFGADSKGQLSFL